RDKFAHAGCPCRLPGLRTLRGNESCRSAHDRDLWRIAATLPGALAVVQTRRALPGRTVSACRYRTVPPERLPGDTRPRGRDGLPLTAAATPGWGKRPDSRVGAA